MRNTGKACKILHIAAGAGRQNTDFRPQIELSEYEGMKRSRLFFIHDSFFFVGVRFDAHFRDVRAAKCAIEFGKI